MINSTLSTVIQEIKYMYGIEWVGGVGAGRKCVLCDYSLRCSFVGQLIVLVCG